LSIALRKASFCSSIMLMCTDPLDRINFPASETIFLVTGSNTSKKITFISRYILYKYNIYYRVIPCQVSHLMDGMFTDFAEILHTIWDMKKNPRTRRWAFWDLRGRRYGSGKFPIFRDFEDGLYISNGSNFFVFEDSSKKFSVLNR